MTYPASPFDAPTMSLRRESFGDNGAMMQGYTRHVLIEGPDACFAALVKPNVDFDTRFKCYDTDNQEWLSVNGWMIESVEDCE